MKAQYVTVTIDMGVMSKIEKQVLAHEVALLREVRGGDAVILMGPAKDENGNNMYREVNGNQEYERLAELFKENPDTGQLRVESVYGRQGSGGLKAAIKGGISAIPEMSEHGGEDEVGSEEDDDALESADFDASGYTNMDEIKAALIDMGVDYSSKAKRPELVTLLQAASQVVASGGDPAGKGLDELQDEAEQAAAT